MALGRVGSRLGFPGGRRGCDRPRLDDDASASLPLPAKSALLDDATRAIAAADRAATAAAASDAIFEALCTDLYGQPNLIGAVVIGHLSHAGRHLEMIEARGGLSGRRTATS